MRCFPAGYADDIVVFTYYQADIQEKIKLVAQYCMETFFTVNGAKSKVMLQHKGRPYEYKFIYAQTQLAVVSEFIYLGAHT